MGDGWRRNDTRFSRSDALINKAKSGRSKVRMEALHKAEDILMDEMPIASIYFYGSYMKRIT